MSSPGLFEKALERGRAVEVAMGNVGYIVFGPSQTSIGTRKLGGCSVALIVSKTAAILAHIPSRPANAAPDDLEAGDKNVTKMMEQVASTFQHLQKHFKEDSHSWVICAVFNVGDPAVLGDQQSIIRNFLNKMGLRVYEANYTAGPSSKSDFPGKGTVFVDMSNGSPEIYIEDTLMKPDPSGKVVSDSSQQKSPQSSSWSPFLAAPPKLWSSKDLRFYTIDAHGQVNWEERQYLHDPASNKFYFVDPDGQTQWMGENDEKLIYGNVQMESAQQSAPLQNPAKPIGEVYFDEASQRWYVSDGQGQAKWMDKVTLPDGVFFDNKHGRFYYIDSNNQAQWI